MKILFIAPRLEGGIGVHVSRVAEKLRKNGFNFLMNNLTWEILLPKYIKFYEKLLNS